MVKVISIISICFFFFGEIEGYDVVPAGFSDKVKRQRQDVKSSIDLLEHTMMTGFEASAKGADETIRFAIQSCSESVANLSAHLEECLGKDDHLISLSTRLEGIQGDLRSDNMGSVWVTIQVFSGVGVFGILCTLGLVGYVIYQRSVIKQLLQKQQESCSNCTQLKSIAFDHLLSSSHSSTPSSTFALGGVPPMGTPAPTPVPAPRPVTRTVDDSGNPPSIALNIGA